MRKKTYNEIMERLDKLEKGLTSVSATVGYNKESVEEAARKIEELSETIANLTDDGEALTPRQILRQYFYGKQEDDEK